ncbi:MAG TPA: hypothetical protein VFS64_06815, partial [Solirubrobacterales bacterium]|nr:hypothetical protein [Solirubrobacterales bacterium]
MKAGVLAWRAIMVVSALVALPSPVARAAEGERQLDPVLSLTGGCTTEAPDLVPDPGLCPMPPGVPGVDHPSEPFAKPMAVATDFYGDIYVSSFGKAADGSEGRIDIFDPQGFFITEIGREGVGEPGIPAGYTPTSLAIDSNGILYVLLKKPGGNIRIDRYTPSPYEPEAGELAYGNAPVEVELGPGRAASPFTGIAINPGNNRLFANFGNGGLVEYTSAEDGNTEVTSTRVGVSPYGVGAAIDAARQRLYASHVNERIDIFDLEQVNGNNEHELIGTIDGSAVPAGHFTGELSVAVNEGNGNAFVLDRAVNRLYEFAINEGSDGTMHGEYLRTIEPEGGFSAMQGAEIGVDNGPSSPNGAKSTRGRYLYVPSGTTLLGHSFAFEESQEHPPVVKSVSAVGIGEVEAELVATVNPGSLPTTYTFEYTTRQHYEEAGNTFAGASVAGGGQLPAVNADREASAIAMGLVPGTEYLFLVHATNAKGEDAAAGSFATYPTPSLEPTPCPN